MTTFHVVLLEVINDSECYILGPTLGVEKNFLRPWYFRDSCAGYPDIYETSGLAPLQHHLPNCMMNITCKPGGCLVSQKYLKAVLWWVMLSQKSTWFVIQRYLCCSTLVSSLTLYFVLFGPHWLLMRQVLLFVVRRNNKLGLSAVYSDKIAMEKAEHLSWDLTLEL